MSFLSLASILSFTIKIGDLIPLAEKNDKNYSVAQKKTKRSELEWRKTLSLALPKISGQFTGSRNNQEIQVNYKNT